MLRTMSGDIQPQTIYPGRAGQVARLAVCLVLTAVGVFLASIGDGAGIVCAGFFGLLGFVFALELIGRPSYLRIDRDGVEVASLFRAQEVRWADVEAFGVVTERRPRGREQKLVVYWSRGGERARGRHDGALRHTAGMDEERLAAHLGDCLVRTRPATGRRLDRQAR